MRNAKHRKYVCEFKGYLINISLLTLALLLRELFNPIGSEMIASRYNNSESKNAARVRILKYNRFSTTRATKTARQ